MERIVYVRPLEETETFRAFVKNVYILCIVKNVYTLCIEKKRYITTWLALFF